MRSEAQFLTVPVSNEVTDINPEFQKQLDIDVGQSSGLVRLWSGEEERGILLGAETRHNRVANIDNTFVIDSHGLRWEDIDIKSPGLTEIGVGDNELQLFPWERMPETEFVEARIWGGNELTSARRAFRYQQILEHLGVRTYKSLFVTKLNEWMYHGKKVPISQIPVVPRDAEAKGHEDGIPDGFSLAAEVRACRTKTRMQAISEREVLTEGNRVYIQKEIDRARVLVAEERGLANVSVPDYIDWFIDSYGRNLGLMHAAGLVHSFMHPGNITLDCRILDLDSMQKLEEAFVAQSESASHYNTRVNKEYSRELYVTRDTRTVNLAHFVRVVCAAYDVPFTIHVSKRFMDAYTRAQMNVPEASKTIQYAQKAQVRS